MHRRQPTSILGSYFERFRKVGLKDAFRLAVGVAIFGVATAVLLHTAEHTPGPQAQTFLQWSLGCLASSNDAITFILPLCPTKNKLACGHVLIHPVGEHVELLELFYASSNTDFFSFLKADLGSQWGAITVIIINSPVLGKCAVSSLERLIGTIIGGWIGYAFYLATNMQNRAWLPIISVIYAFAAAVIGAALDVGGAANLSTITLLSGKPPPSPPITAPVSLEQQHVCLPGPLCLICMVCSKCFCHHPALRHFAPAPSSPCKCQHTAAPCTPPCSLPAT